MPEVAQIQVSGAKDVRAIIFEQSADVAVGAADTPLAEFLTNGEGGPLFISVQNTGAQPFTAAVIAAQASPSSPPAAGNLFPAYITGAQLHAMTYVQDLLIATSGDLTTLAAGANVNLAIKVNGAYRIQIRATSANGTTARCRGTMARGGS